MPDLSLIFMAGVVAGIAGLQVYRCAHDVGNLVCLVRDFRAARSGDWAGELPGASSARRSRVGKREGWYGWLPTPARQPSVQVDRRSRVTSDSPLPPLDHR